MSVELSRSVASLNGGLRPIAIALKLERSPISGMYS